MQAVHVAAKLGIADLVAGGPQTVEALAQATHTHGPSLGRLLRALTSLGIFGEDNCRRAIRPDGRLFILDTVLTPSSDPAGALMDVLMMVLPGGRERTESEFRALLLEAGFSLEKVMPTAGGSILESRPV